MRIVFMGTPGFAEVILRALVKDEEIKVVGLFTQMALTGFQMICLCKVKIQVLRHI